MVLRSQDLHLLKEVFSHPQQRVDVHQLNEVLSECVVVTVDFSQFLLQLLKCGLKV